MFMAVEFQYGYFFMLFAVFRFIHLKEIKKNRNTTRVPNSLDPDQAQRLVVPGLGPRCLQRFSAANKTHHNE